MKTALNAVAWSTERQRALLHLSTTIERPLTTSRLQVKGGSDRDHEDGEERGGERRMGRGKS